MSNETILILDDEKEITDLLEIYLKNENFLVRKFYNPLNALAYLEKEPVSLAILDVMMPEMDGFTLCQKIRQKYLFPIIMLTAKIEDIDKIQGLTLGADDYATTLSAIMVGSSETTFYVLAVYFGAVGISKLRYALLVGLLADIIGIVAAVCVCNWMFL